MVAATVAIATAVSITVVLAIAVVSKYRALWYVQLKLSTRHKVVLVNLLKSLVKRLKFS